MTWKRWTGGLSLALLMSVGTGCASRPAEIVVINECEWVRPIFPTQADIDLISDDLVRQLLRHNDLVELRCP